MKKIDILKRLEQFNDSDEIMIESSYSEIIHPYQFKPLVICGKEDIEMGYVCTSKPNHSGDCYCSNKGVDFIPAS